MTLYMVEMSNTIELELLFTRWCHNHVICACYTTLQASQHDSMSTGAPLLFQLESLFLHLMFACSAFKYVWVEHYSSVSDEALRLHGIKGNY